MDYDKDTLRKQWLIINWMHESCLFSLKRRNAEKGNKCWSVLSESFGEFFQVHLITLSTVPSIPRIYNFLWRRRNTPEVCKSFLDKKWKERRNRSLLLLKVGNDLFGRSIFRETRSDTSKNWTQNCNTKRLIAVL